MFLAFEALWAQAKWPHVAPSKDRWSYKVDMFYRCCYCNTIASSMEAFHANRYGIPKISGSYTEKHKRRSETAAWTENESD